MKINALLSIASLCFCAGAVHAETFYLNVPTGVGAPTGATTTPAVQSDAQRRAERYIWKLSGMQSLTARQRSDQYGPTYERAKARYDALMASPDYAQLVEALARNPDLVVAAK